MFDAHQIKKDFPILSQQINGKPLAYLDSAATTQKPQTVINALTNYYENYNANVHRALHTLAEKATQAYEDTRLVIAEFINAPNEKEIIYTKNATEAVNIVAYSYGSKYVEEGDEIIVSGLEHHSNLVPWQQLAKRQKAQLKVIPITQDYTLNIEEYKKLLSDKTKIVAVTGNSNVTGTIIDIKSIIELAHDYGAVVLIDGAQMTSHMPVDVQALDCDFLTMSAHKMLGPTGVGILYGKEALLDLMPPLKFGGDMIKTVSQFDAEWADLPWRFEAGTQNIADIIAFTQAIKYLQKLGMDNVLKHDQEILAYAKEKFDQYPEVTTYSPQDISKCSGILSFTIEGIHPHDIATIFNSEGVAIRSGQHCAEPLMNQLNLPATARISFHVYNTKEDIDQAEVALQKTISTFK